MRLLLIVMLIMIFDLLRNIHILIASRTDPSNMMILLSLRGWLLLLLLLNSDVIVQQYCHIYWHLRAVQFVSVLCCLLHLIVIVQLSI